MRSRSIARVAERGLLKKVDYRVDVISLRERGLLEVIGTEQGGHLQSGREGQSLSCASNWMLVLVLVPVIVWMNLD